MSSDFLGLSTFGKTPSRLELEQMGKQASIMFVDQGVPLTDAVVKVAQSKEGLSPQHVLRITEFANRDTFLDAHEKAAGDKNVEFEIADPKTVLSQLNMSVAPSTVKVASSDYASPPPSLDFEDVEADIKLAQAFGVDMSEADKLIKEAKASMAPMEQLEQVVKLASLGQLGEVLTEDGYEQANPWRELHETRWSLQKVAEELDSAAAQNSKDWGFEKQALDAVHYELRQQLLEGSGISDPWQAMVSICGQEKAAHLLQTFQPELEKLAAAGRVDLGELMAESVHSSLESRSLSLNPESSFVQKTAAWSRAYDENQALDHARQEVGALLKEARRLEAEAVKRSRK